jgi:hypothetical protein
MKKVFIVLLVVFLYLSGTTHASQYQRFKTDIIEPYSYYKKSLALTSKKKNQDKAVYNLEKFVDTWSTFAKKYEHDIPDELKQVNNFNSKINQPYQIAQEALEMLKNNKTKASHIHLEQIRYVLWKMRVDAGIISLNDKINDFHEAMEIVLNGISKGKSPDSLKYLGNRYGKWLEIKWAEVGREVSGVEDKQPFKSAHANGKTAINELYQALINGHFNEARSAGQKLKKSYKAIFFLPECS